MSKLIKNAIRCPDGTVLESRHRHDFQMHTQDDGRQYMVDGGLEYQRVGFSDQEFEDLSCYVGDPHEKIREHFMWKSVLDEHEEKLPKPVCRALKDLTDSHIDALITFTATDYPDFIHDLFVAEKQYREVVNELLAKLDLA